MQSNEYLLHRNIYLLVSLAFSSLSTMTIVGCGGGGGDKFSPLDKRRICLSTIVDSVLLSS